MTRLTRAKDSFECRVNICPAETWFLNHYGDYPKDEICDDCPFERYINRLAEIEDMMEDDLK